MKRNEDSDSDEDMLAGRDQDLVIDRVLDYVEMVLYAQRIKTD